MCYINLLFRLSKLFLKMPKKPSSELSKKNKLIKAGASEKSVIKQLNMTKIVKESKIVRKHRKK